MFCCYPYGIHVSTVWWFLLPVSQAQQELCYSHVQQLGLPTPLDSARGNDSPHIQSQLASLEHSHSPGLTVCPVFSGDLTLGFQKSSSKSWFGRIICFHNFSRQSILRNAMQRNRPHYFKTMTPPQWRWSILAFSVHILFLFFCISIGKSKSERQFNAFFFFNSNATITAQHTCLVLKIVTVGLIVVKPFIGLS